MSHPRSSLSLVTDAAEAQVRLADLVAREPGALSVLASVTEGIVASPDTGRGARWWVVTGGAGPTAPAAASAPVVGAFLHTPPHPLHIALATPDEARGLAARLADAGDQLPGVGGQRDAAEAFADEWSRRTGSAARVSRELGRFELPHRPSLPFAVSGSFRIASADDAGLVDAWHQQFFDAVEGDGRRASSLTRHLADGRVGLWEDGGRPASMAYASVATCGVTRVSGVWTPPGWRGHGYASAVVAALSTARLDRGELCTLYTDLANPTSNAIYQAMGYRRVADSITITFGG